MAAGNTTTGSLADSQELIIDSARIVREFDGVFNRVCDVQRLSENTGLSWEEISLAQMEAQAITETTMLDNPQQFADTLFTITPTVIGIQTIVTDRVYRRLNKKTISKMGSLAQNAIQRKKDEDYLTVLDGFATSLSGAGSTLTSGIVSAAVARITGNTTEPSMGSIFTVLHPFQLKDLQDEIVAGIGTYTVPAGITEETYRKGFAGSLFNSNVFTDGNISIDSADDAKGGCHAREAVVMVQGHSLRPEKERMPRLGGGADCLILYDEYAYGERSAGNWGYEIYSDATAPTS